MRHQRYLASAAASATMLAVVLAGTVPTRAAEPPTVKVKLVNKSDGSMHIELSRTSVPAGPVEFDIKNTSKSLMHEFLIAPWKGKLTALPYDKSQAQAAEDKIPGLQGQEDMKPGLETTLRLTLHPGSYIVFCNQPGHYKMGMYARFTVNASS